MLPGIILQQHDYPVEKLMRDAKVFQIFDGTNQVNRWNAAKWIKKEYTKRKK